MVKAHWFDLFSVNRAYHFIGVLVGSNLMFVTLALADVEGKARVVDGDTIVINEDRIRLHGIDAPEQIQTCLVANIEWQCGVEATEALERMIAEQKVHCLGQKRDRYKRLIAVCYAGLVNLNRQMVSEGWALVYRRYSDDYISEEMEARNSKRGVWEGEFVPPWEWRKIQRSRSK
ncbi:uncharacterized protein METZ01_LOCUS339266 [marine metagenome]|uniref:TNase-like domain-containing protein n=1 Tax=marine metagenome TaxID=408172 RepID=A0A382QNT7_9ZZZZ